VADLHRRLATAHEKLGRDEAAYQTLVAADRLHRGHLLIKLALGENRYKARRWREAALHFAPLASHEDAPRYPSEVAQGLYHAAAVGAAQPLEARHVPLLDKLLARQDLARDHAGAARTAELMAAFGATPADRAARYLRAARDYLAAGDATRARAAADRAVDS